MSLFAGSIPRLRAMTDPDARSAPDAGSDPDTRSDPDAGPLTEPLADSRDQSSLPFWKTKPLSAMSAEEWESLCDGCGQCCLLKLEDEDTGAVATTSVACRGLDTERCRCRFYARRQREVPDCIVLTPEKVSAFDWLPETCAYRRIEAGLDLLPWHPLVSGDPESVHRAGLSVRGKVISEKAMKGPLARHITRWSK